MFVCSLFLFLGCLCFFGCFSFGFGCFSFGFVCFLLECFGVVLLVLFFGYYFCFCSCLFRLECLCFFFGGVGWVGWGLFLFWYLCLFECFGCCSSFSVCLKHWFPCNSIVFRV